MKLVIGITLIVLVAVLGSRWTFTRARLPLGARRILLTGAEFLVVGICLGELLLGLLDRSTLAGLSPLLDLSLGWLGLMFGAQLEYRQLTRFPRQYPSVALLLGGFTAAACLPMGFLLEPLPGAEERPWLGALVLAAAAIPSAQSSLALVVRELGARRDKVTEVLSYVAGLDALAGLALFGLVFTLPQTHAPLGPEQLFALQYLLLSLGLGGLMGLILHLLTRFGCSQAELLLFTVGSVALAAGVAAFLKLSPLVVTVVSGSVIANLKGERSRILQVLLPLEKPLYLVLLIFAGAMVRPVPQLALVLLLVLPYMALRGAGKVLGGFVGSLLFDRPVRLPRALGLGLTGQGAMAVAMVVNFQRGLSDQPALAPLCATVLLLVLLSLVLNELLSPSLARLVIGRKV